MSVLETLDNTAAAWSERASASTSWEAAGWTENGQTERFTAVLASADLQPGERLLDYGCGTGRLTEFLPADVEYLGYDPALGMVERARRDHPDRLFQAWEPLPHRNYDVIVAIGAFNVAGRWSKQHTWQTLRRLWDATGRVLAVSLYAGDDDRCLIYTDDEVAAFARGHAYHSNVERHRHNDLLLVLER